MKQWIDRNWNLIFHKKNCWQLTFPKDYFKYNDVYVNAYGCYGRYLGNDWFKKIRYGHRAH